MRISGRERRTPVHGPPRSCRRLSLEQHHLSMNAACMTGDGTGPRRRRATTQCDHAVTALDTVPCACTPATVNCDNSCLLAARHAAQSLNTPSIPLWPRLLSTLQTFESCVSKNAPSLGYCNFHWNNWAANKDGNSQLILYKLNVCITAKIKLLLPANQKAPQGGCGHRRQHARLR